MEEAGGHLDSLKSKDEEARAFMSLQKYEEALKTYNEIYDIQKSRYRSEPEHTRILSAMNNIASTLISMGKCDEALKILNEIDEKIERKNPGPHFAAVAQHTRATLYQEEGKHDEAFRMYNKALVIFKKEFGLNHSYTLAVQTNIAGLLHILGKNFAALQVYKSVLKRKIAILGPENPSTLHTRRCVAYMLINTGKHDDAMNVLGDIYKQRCNTLGPDHPDTLATARSIELLKIRASNSHE